jgi:hypothetical protein
VFSHRLTEHDAHLYIVGASYGVDKITSYDLAAKYIFCVTTYGPAGLFRHSATLRRWLHVPCYPCPCSSTVYTCSIGTQIKSISAVPINHSTRRKKRENIFFTHTGRRFATIQRKKKNKQTRKRKPFSGFRFYTSDERIGDRVSTGRSCRWSPAGSGHRRAPENFGLCHKRAARRSRFCPHHDLVS